MLWGRQPRWLRLGLLTALVLATLIALHVSEVTGGSDLSPATAAASPEIPAVGTAYDWPQFDGNAQHSGNNSQETTISAANVNTLTRLFQVTLPGVADGAPAYLSNILVGGVSRNLLFLTTTDGHILALDAHTGATIWSHQYGPGSCHINNGSSPCYTTSSPAIDPNRQYVYSYGIDGKVHKYQVANGTEITTGGWPELTTLKGFDEKGSSALSVATSKNGASYLYVANGGYPGDNGDYQGHVTAINLATGAQNVFNAACSNMAVHFVEKPGTPDCPQVQTAIWSRPGVVYDPNTDRIYMATGNGIFNPTGHDWGDTVFSLNPDGTGLNGDPLDTYTPTNQQDLNNSDSDLGSTAPAILPAAGNSTYQHLGVQSGKDGNLRLLNLDNLSNQGGIGHTGGEIGAIIPVPQGGAVLTTPAVWVNPVDSSIWVFVANQSGISGLKLSVNGSGIPGLQKVWQNGNPGTSPIVANNVLYYAGSQNLWALDPTTGNTLWHSTAIGTIHWESPIVANGALYITDGARGLSAFVPTGGTPSPTATPSPTGKPSPTATPAATGKPGPQSGPAINSGGGNVAPFVADTDFSGGAATSTAHPINTAAVTNPAPQGVYQTARIGTFSYTIPGLTAGARYTVRLHFAEIHPSFYGSNTFNVSINGTPVLSNFTIAKAAGGNYIAIVKGFTATAGAGGTIRIQFTPILRSLAESNGIEILPIGS